MEVGAVCNRTGSEAETADTPKLLSSPVGFISLDVSAARDSLLLKSLPKRIHLFMEFFKRPVVLYNNIRILDFLRDRHL